MSGPDRDPGPGVGSGAQPGSGRGAGSGNGADSGGGASAGSGRWARLLLVAAITLAGVGYFLGLGDGVPRSDPGPDSVVPVETGAGSDGPDSGGPATTSVPPALSYRELSARGPQSLGEGQRRVRDLGLLAVDLTDSVLVEADKKSASLQERAARRAYNGAPPVIPHAVDPYDGVGCLSCHGPGLEVASRRAPLVPHPYFENCQQCHVAGSPVFPEFELAANSFDGVAAPTEGPRAWPGAPPVIPHSTWMRSECLTCHGPLGKPGLRTSHPERLNCLQCHGRWAAMDPSDPSVSRHAQPARLDPWAGLGTP